MQNAHLNCAVTTNAGTMGAYLALPTENAGTPAPAIIVIQEIFGVNADVRAKCDAWAAKGYVALAPDLFWRQEAGVDLTDKTEEEWARAFALLQGFDVDAGVADLAASLAFLAAHPACNGNVGAVGYCLGGRLAYLMATRTNVQAAVSYYGVTIENYLAESTTIKNPLMLHIAEADEYVNTAAQAQIKSTLSPVAGVVLHSYPQQNHAFSRQNGKHYNAEAASLANARTEEFFGRYLRV